MKNLKKSFNSKEARDCYLKMILKKQSEIEFFKLKKKKKLKI